MTNYKRLFLKKCSIAFNNIHAEYMFKCGIVIMITAFLFSCESPIDEAVKKEIDITSGNYDCITLTTNLGTISLALDNVKAPQSVSNFLRYSNSLAYNDSIFHRVIDGFVVQGGGYDSSFNSIDTDAPITNEADNGLLNVRGSIAAARAAAPHSATSQFYINTVNNPGLDHIGDTSTGWGYAVFGQVINGMDVVDAIGTTATGAGGPFDQDVPLDQVVIQTSQSVSCDTL